MKSTTMNVSLSPELASFVRERVQSGQYSSASEVVRDALRLLSAQGATRSRETARFDLFGRGYDLSRAEAAVHEIREAAAGRTLGSLTLEELIDEGRRR